MHLTATAATPPPPIQAASGLPPALPSTQLTMTGGGGLSRFPVKAIIGGVLGAGLGFLLLGPIGGLAGGAIGAFLGARMSAPSPRQS